MKGLARAACLLLVIVPAAGCALKRAPAVQRQFLLEADRPDPRPAEPDGMLLQLRTLRVSAAYEGRGFVYRKKDGTIEQDFHNRFFVLPAYLITNEVRRWLSGTGFIRHVTSTAGVDGSRYTLTGDVVELYGDYSSDQPAAVLRIEFNVADGETGAEFVFHRKYHRRVPVSSGPDALVQGWNRGLTDLLGQLEDDLRQAFSAGQMPRAGESSGP